MLLNTFSPLGDVPRVKLATIKVRRQKNPHAQVALLRCHMAAFQTRGEDIKAGLG